MLTAFAVVKDAASFELAKKEAMALKQLQQCTGIIKMHDFVTHENCNLPNAYSRRGDVYIVQELGVPFLGYNELDDRADVWVDRANMMYQLTMGLLAIHTRGWMHRDLTRRNLLLSREERDRAMICDFGLIHFNTHHNDPYFGDVRSRPPEVTPSVHVS